MKVVHLTILIACVAAAFLGGGGGQEASIELAAMLDGRAKGKKMKAHFFFSPDLAKKKKERKTAATQAIILRCAACSWWNVYQSALTAPYQQISLGMNTNCKVRFFQTFYNTQLIDTNL